MHEGGMRSLKLAVLSLFLWTFSAFSQDIGIRYFQGNYNGTDQSIIATPGLGKRLCVRSLVLSTEDTNTDWRFLSKPTGASTAFIPNIDYPSNSGIVLPPDNTCWFILPENTAWVVTTNNPVDIFGTYKIVPK
jgi:hypothetical protein